MDIMKKFIRLLQDDYKVGVEKQSQKNILYFDHSKIDSHSITEHAKKKDAESAAAEIGRQLDEQYPGITQNFRKEELIQLYLDSKTMGPFADRRLNSLNICIINMPKDNQLDNNRILQTFGLDQVFKPEHLKPLPGSNAQWKQLVGEHEGEHCNQEPTFNNDPEAGLKTFRQEILADRSSIASLRADGHHDLAQALIDIRAVAAANGDAEHATSIFLEQGDHSDITPQHYDAAKTFVQEMNLAVMDKMKISDEAADKLRTTDPRQYATIVSQALEEGKIPVAHNAPDKLVQERVAQKLGVSVEDLENPQKVAPHNAYATYQTMKDNNELKTANDNPIVKQYIRQYVGAVDRLFVADTSPKADSILAPKPEAEQSPAPPAYAPETSTESPAINDEVLEYSAKTQHEDLLHKAVSQSLGLNEEAATALMEHDPGRYAEIAQDLLDKNKIPLQTTHFKNGAEIATMVMEELKLSAQEYNQTPYFLIRLTEKKLESEDKHIIVVDNPYLKELMQGAIDEKKDAAAKNLESDKQAPQASSTPQISERFSYLSHTQPDTNKGAPAIALYEGDKATLSVGKLSMPEYFALQADQVLAQQTLAAKMMDKNELQNTAQPGNDPSPQRDNCTPSLQTISM